MTAPLHERLAEAAKVANQDEWHITIEASWCKAIVTIDGEMENGDPSEQTIVTANAYREDANQTLAYLVAAQPANVAKLCEQVRVMKEALEDIQVTTDSPRIRKFAQNTLEISGVNK